MKRSLRALTGLAVIGSLGLAA
ncbi:MAG: hypothetical protein RLZ04_457, partial [Actinomycetota bacterium]